MDRTQKEKLKKRELYNLIRKLRLVVFDFDGVFTDNRVVVLQDGSEGVFCCRADGFGLSELKRAGIETLVLSTEVNSIVSVRCRKLGLRCIQGCGSKLEVLRSEASKLNIPLEKVAYLGNDINDIECLKEAGLPACVADSHPDVIAAARLVTRLPGGYGAVREFCDLIVKVKNGKLS